MKLLNELKKRNITIYKLVKTMYGTQKGATNWSNVYRDILLGKRKISVEKLELLVNAISQLAPDIKIEDYVVCKQTIEEEYRII
jgi:hypothetical protein